MQPLDLPSDGCKGCNWSISAKSRWKCKLVLVLESVLPFFPSFKSYVDLSVFCLPKLHKHYRSNHWTSRGALHMRFEVIYSVLFICVVGPIIAGLYFLYGAFHTEFSMALSMDKRKWTVQCLESRLVGKDAKRIAYESFTHHLYRILETQC